MERNMESMERDLKELGIRLNEKQLNQFYRYYELLVEWNKVMNLTAITDFEEVLKKHFVDSLSLVRACDIQNLNSVIDVGTGAGFPGLALKIAFPQLHVTLLDSLQKRIQFLDTVKQELELENVTAVHGRAEDYAVKGKLREQFDLCVSRAVANLATLSEYCLPYVKVGGLFIPYKSEKTSLELQEALKSVSILGGKVEQQVEFQLPASDIYRNLVVIRKERPTPLKYPRKAGMPAKVPLK